MPFRKLADSVQPDPPTLHMLVLFCRSLIMFYFLSDVYYYSQRCCCKIIFHSCFGAEYQPIKNFFCFNCSSLDRGLNWNIWNISKVGLNQKLVEIKWKWSKIQLILIFLIKFDQFFNLFHHIIFLTDISNVFFNFYLTKKNHGDGINNAIEGF